MFISYSFYICFFSEGKTDSGVGKGKGDGVEKVDYSVVSKTNPGVGEIMGDGVEKVEYPVASKSDPVVGKTKVDKSDDNKKADYPVAPKVQGSNLLVACYVTGWKWFLGLF